LRPPGSCLFWWVGEEHWKKRALL